MNVLPLIGAFLILFSASIYGFFQQSKDASQKQYHYFGALDLSRQYDNAITKDRYKKKRGENLEKKESASNTQTSSKEKRSPRDTRQSVPAQKLNITKLKEPVPPEKLANVTQSLLRSIYQSAPFYTDGLEKSLLDVIITTLKEHPHIGDFPALLTHLPEHEVPLFYQLVRGTQNYDLEKGIGYPPISDFIDLNPKNTKPIHLRRASIPVLHALFGEKITHSLLEKEAEKSEDAKSFQTLTKGEMEQFFSDQRINLSLLSDLVDFSNAKNGTVQKRLKAKHQTMQMKR